MMARILASELDKAYFWTMVMDSEEGNGFKNMPWSGRKVLMG